MSKSAFSNHNHVDIRITFKIILNFHISNCRTYHRTQQQIRSWYSRPTTENTTRNTTHLFIFYVIGEIDTAANQPGIYNYIFNITLLFHYCGFFFPFLWYSFNFCYSL